MVSLYPQQQIPQSPHKQSTIQTQQQPRIQPQQQQLNRAAPYINKYANHRPQPQTVIYNTRHQANKPFESPIQQTSHRVNYNYAKVRFFKYSQFSLGTCIRLYKLACITK